MLKINARIIVMLKRFI